MKNELVNKAITAFKTYVKSKEKYVEDKEKYKSSLDNILGAIVKTTNWFFIMLCVKHCTKCGDILLG